MRLNTKSLIPSAFISSTFIDLKKERSIVAEILRNEGLYINALDVQPASTKSSKNKIIEGIEASDFIILIVGERYGSIIPQMTGSQMLSITWWEYQNARKLRRPVLVFFKSITDLSPINHDDKNASDYDFKRQKLIRFKDILSRDHDPKYFSSVSELSIQIKKSLISVYREGFKYQQEKHDDLRRKINIKPEKKELDSKVESLSPLENEQQTNNILIGLRSI
ncbi:MAG: DUF4062 domain-containing protein [Desulfobacteraceae bacterium]|jgi:hypothetical protein